MATAIMVSKYRSIPAGFQIQKFYGSIQAKGGDVNEAFQALLDRANSLQKYQGTNWILGLAFQEIPGTTCTATGLAYNLVAG